MVGGDDQIARQQAVDDFVIRDIETAHRSASAVLLGGITLADLQRANGLSGKIRLAGGSTLLVPRSQAREQDVSETVADNAMMALAPDLPPMRRLVLKADLQDTMSGFFMVRRMVVLGNEQAVLDDSEGRLLDDVRFAFAERSR